ncbi:phenylalanyl-tRNA synthetase beta subunit [Sulfurivirga caldicuralii]|uniref:Phenylalanine--tRNA ligase beta subunit n=1 Tax=Sulfurivirga caldicuralii TaxID=364032 RepID=A0A1N6DXP6_9GAMM|nr:phenylalanine--tRNA ligase subunit beta [Sulfurivirga caldicuralii]SIN75568.1 phenylalanyl-tRNA synthetase beta subunit [Sulfurivirga caldicuralii]
MKVSKHWIEAWTRPQWSAEEMSEALSLAGLEVDEVALAAPPFSGVVVGQVLSVEKHPDADKLNVTQVDVGEEAPLQIVCGARNVRPGMKAPCAKVGAVLPGGFKIKKAKLRGVPSFGMLCSASELGLAEQADGLMELPADAPIGEDLRAYLDLDDPVIDIDLTPNRGDCLSHEGIAREVSALAETPFEQPYTIKPVDAAFESAIDVVVEAPEACPRYLGVEVRGFKNGMETPLWLQERLRRCGVRSISLVVDITNYVLLELGQPMHAFDADTLQGKIVVRMAKEGEQLTTLDGKQLTLKPNTLVIADASGPIALAGIMGGEATAVSEKTQRIFFEAAHFTPTAIAGRARQYGLHTDSSHRFERGVDPELPEKALWRAVDLLLELAGGEVSQVVRRESAEHLPAPTMIRLHQEKIERVIGMVFPAALVESLLKRLHFEVKAVEPGVWDVTAPSWRFDMAIEEDLIEELARLYGYNRLPESAVHAPMQLGQLPETQLDEDRLRTALVERGYHEVITYSFIDRDSAERFALERQLVSLANPLSEDLSTMRPSLLPGLLKALAYNQKRQQLRVRVFELGRVFARDGEGYAQQHRIGGAIYGSRKPLHWDTPVEIVDFFDIKGDVEALLAAADLDVVFEPTSHPALHPGQSAQVVHDGTVIGWLGQLHPQLYKANKIAQPVFVFELALEPLLQARLPQAQPVSRFPEVLRDLAFVVNADVPVARLDAAIATHAPAILKQWQWFDLYEGDNLPAGKKSLAVKLRFSDVERTLEDADVEAAVNQIIESVARETGAQLR